ncbi:MAG: hypothetical protein SFU83_05385 [Meiothermus sp.]|nr:hypothetical protein [Meiothermus sp.]
MVRALILLFALWVLSIAGFAALYRVPKGSPLWGLRDFAWMFMLATSVIGLLAFIGVLTGLIEIAENPFGSSTRP